MMSLFYRVEGNPEMPRPLYETLMYFSTLLSHSGATGNSVYSEGTLADPNGFSYIVNANSPFSLDASVCNAVESSKDRSPIREDGIAV